MHSDFLKRDIFLLEIIVVLKRHVSRVEVIVWGSMCFLEACKLFTCFHLILNDLSEIEFGEYAVMRYPVIHGMRLIIVIMLEV